MVPTFTWGLSRLNASLAMMGQVDCGLVWLLLLEKAIAFTEI
jgi:hypothetical protein